MFSPRTLRFSHYALPAVLLTVLAPVAYGQSSSPANRFERTPSSGRVLPGVVPRGAKSAQLATVTVVVELADEPIALARGRAPGRHLAAASELLLAGRLRSKQDAMAPALQAHGAKILAKMQYAINGIKIQIPENKIDAISHLPGVIAVRRVLIHTLDNATSVPFIGAPLVWAGTPGVHGENIKIGIIDTGIDYTHANFGGPGTVAAFQAAAASSTQPADPSVFGPTAPKVKGGYDLVGDAYTGVNTPVPDPNPLDCAGHGSHVAGTAAGLGVLANGTTFTGPYDLTTPSNKFLIGPGVAPAADIYSFRVFGCSGSTSVVVEAIDMAVKAGVNVISMSLGSPFGSKDSADAVASSNAEKAGIIVVASSGNSGNIPYISGSPAAGDRVISVAAMESHSSFPGVALALPGGATLAAQNSNGASFSDGTSLPIVVLRNPDNTISLGCNEVEYTNTDVTGKLVVTMRGTCARILRAQYGALHGAAAVAMINNSASGYPPVEGPISGVTIPFIGVLQSDGAALAAAASATLTNSTIPNPTFGQFASFTSKGPLIGTATLKPDITAPGVNIVSTAIGTGTGGATLSGTSMAAPHVAGVAALALQAHPGWTADDVRLAILNTADPTQLTGFLPSLGGAGLVQAYPATLTYTNAQGANGGGSLSFGLLESAVDFQTSGNLTLRNLSHQSVNFNISSQASQGSSPHSLNVASTVGISPGGLATVPVGLTVPVATSGDSSAFREVSGTITLTPTSGSNAGVSLNVPYYLVPRARTLVSSTVGSNFGPLRNTSTTAQVTNLSTSLTGSADFYEWGLSGSNSVLGSVGLRAVGAQSSQFGPQVVTFAVNTFAPWSYVGTKEFDILIDVNGDGIPDFDVFSYDSGGRPAVAVGNLVTHSAYFESYATSPDDGSTILLPVRASSLGLSPANPRFSYSAKSYDLYGPDSDSIAGPATFNAYSNSITTGAFVTVGPGQTAAVPLSIDPVEWAKSPSLGVMIVSSDNFAGGQQAQLLPVNTAPPPVNVTVGTSPSNLSFSVDGTTYATAQTFSFDQGSTHTIATNSPQSIGGTQYLWDTWTDAGAISHSITVPTTDTSYTASFHAQNVTTTTISSSLNPSVFGQAVTFSATVTSTGGTPTGTVTFSDGASTLSTVPLSSGVTSFSLSTLGVGPHSIVATYNGDSSDSGSSGSVTQAVHPASSIATIASSLNPAKFGQPVTITTTIQPQFGGTATGSVTFADGATTLGTSPLSGNVATLSVSLAAGKHALQASYGGDSNVAGSISPVLSQVVAKATTSVALASSLNPALVNQSVTYTATVVPQFGGVPSGTVNFKQGTVVVNTAPVVGGVATFTTSYATAGTFGIKATYSGDGNFLTSSSAVLSEVTTKSKVATSVTSSVNPSSFGQLVTFTALLTTSGPSLDTQMVSFKSGTTPLGTATITGGSASISLSSLAAGSRVITAVYAGDAAHSNSSGSATQVVQKATTTTLVTSDINPSAVGQTVTFTATVSSANAVPAGTVKFKDGATLLGTGTLSGGVATLPVTTLASGSHSITVLYVPAANFTASSGLMTQVVQ